MHLESSPYFAVFAAPGAALYSLYGSMQLELRKLLISLTPQPGFEPEGRGVESPPGVPLIPRTYVRVEFPSSGRSSV